MGGRDAGAMAAAHPIQPAGQALVEFEVETNRVEHPLAVLQEPRQDVVEIGDGKGVIRPVQLARPLEPRTAAVPGLHLGVFLAAEEEVFAVSPVGDEDQDRLGLREAGQVIKVAVGTVGEFDVPVAASGRGRGEDPDGAAVHDVHEALAPAGELSLVHRVLGRQSRSPRNAHSAGKAAGSDA